MTAQSMVGDAPNTSKDVTPTRYLRALVAVAPAAKRREYVVVHFGSASFFRTDRLGALVVRALIAGRSDAEAMQLAERFETGAGERAQQLILALGAKGAMTPQPPPTGRRLWLRRMMALALGLPLGVMAPVVRLAPTSTLAWMFEVWPSTPIGRHVWRTNRLMVISNLCASGYADRPEPWLLEISRRCAAYARNYLFMYLSVGISPRRLDRLVDRLFDRESTDALAAHIQVAGATVGVFLHGPLCVVVPNALRIRGREIVRSVLPWTHGTRVSDTYGPIRDYFGETSEMTVDVNDPNASGAFLRHLKAGRSIYVALDERARDGKPAAEIEMLGHRLARNDWPAWIAVRSGRPLALWTTHNASTGVVITASPLLHPDPTLRVDLRVAELTTRLYRYAEGTIREHPEAWTGWGYLSFLKGNQS